MEECSSALENGRGGRQWLKLADTKRKIRQRIGFTKQEGEARADISDQWRKEWRQCQENEIKARGQAEAEESRAAKKRECERLQKLEAALARSYYEALNIPPEGTATAAGRRTALECHPDKFPGNTERATKLFQAVRQAQETLEDPRKRGEYDAQLAAIKLQQGPTRSRAATEPAWVPVGTPMFTVMSRYGGDPWAHEMEEMQIRQQRTQLGIYDNPSDRGECWVILPGGRVCRAQFMGYLKSSIGRVYAAIARVEGESVALSLQLNTRLFQTEAAARRLRAAMQ